MATYALTYIGRMYLIDREAFRTSFRSHWLICTPPKRNAGDVIMTTTKSSRSKVAEGEPVAMEIVKGEKSVFAFGITLGHSENNDLILRDENVSRFHAYFQPQPDRMMLVDANSRNGTFVNNVRMEPNKPFALPSEAILRFGELQVRYLNPDQIQPYLERVSQGQKP